MPIRITNIAHPPQYITLPAPYQGILRSGAVEVIDTTEAEFLEKMGGSNVSLGALTIETTAAAATIEVDRTVTDADLIVAMPNAGGNFATTTNIQVNAIAAFGAITVNMTNADGSDLPEGVIYTIKDVGGDASTYNITVSTPYAVVGESGTDYTIETDDASVGFYRSGSSFVPLPGVSSGGGAAVGTTTFTVNYAAAEPPASPYVMTTGGNYVVEAASGGVPSLLTLPAITAAIWTTTSSHEFTVLDGEGHAGTYPIVVSMASSGGPSYVQGAPNSSYTLNTNWQSVTFFVDADQQWQIK